MGIRFYCPNGHKLNVKEFQAGRRGICLLRGKNNDPDAKHPAGLEAGGPRRRCRPGQRCPSIRTRWTIPRPISCRASLPAGRSRKQQDARPEHRRGNSLRQRPGSRSANPSGRRASRPRYGRPAAPSPPAPLPDATPSDCRRTCADRACQPWARSHRADRSRNADRSRDANRRGPVAPSRPPCPPLPSRPLRRRPTRSPNRRNRSGMYGPHPAGSSVRPPAN